MEEKKEKKGVLSKIILVVVFVLLLASSGLGFYLYKENKDLKSLIFQNQLREERERKEREEEEKRRKDEAYQTCLTKKYEESELTDDLVTLKNDIDAFINSNGYHLSVKYEDMLTGFSYNYKPDQVYYGCSLIKLVDALYLINKAIDGEVDLDAVTVTYTANYKRGSSSGMDSHKFGDKVTLRELIRHAITVSDNTAHIMLINYIGFNTLQEYGRSLGAKNILIGSDAYGNQSANDMSLYLKEAYKIITTNEEYGPFLKEIMGNDVRNSYNTDNVKIYHKYGSYDIYYHDVGLSLDIDNPYAISILTTHEKSNHIGIVQGVHEKVMKLHDAFYENRESVCYKEAYES